MESPAAVRLQAIADSVAKGKCPQEVVTAVSRELLGFIRAIGVQIETKGDESAAA